MLSTYGLERRAGVAHDKVMAALVEDPKPLLLKWRGKRLELNQPVTLDGTKERPAAPFSTRLPVSASP
jgi:hypothetical protein